MKNVSILGSTGSIGTQTLDVIRRNKDINVVALAAGTRVSELAAQVREFRPELVCVGSEELVPQIKQLLADVDVRIVCGNEGLIEAAVIGKVTSGNDRIIHNSEEDRFLGLPEQDEIYRFI